MKSAAEDRCGNDPTGPNGRTMGRFIPSREYVARTLRALRKEPK